MDEARHELGWVEAQFAFHKGPAFRRPAGQPVGAPSRRQRGVLQRKAGAARREVLFPFAQLVGDLDVERTDRVDRVQVLLDDRMLIFGPDLKLREVEQRAEAVGRSGEGRVSTVETTMEDGRSGSC